MVFLFQGSIQISKKDKVYVYLEEFANSLFVQVNALKSKNYEQSVIDLLHNKFGELCDWMIREKKPVNSKDALLSMAYEIGAKEFWNKVESLFDSNTFNQNQRDKVKEMIRGNSGFRQPEKKNDKAMTQTRTKAG